MNSPRQTRFPRLLQALCLMLGLVLATQSQAQNITLPDSIIADQASPQSANEDALMPFGASLFKGGFRGAMGDGMNPNYQVAPGDQIAVRAWGAFEFDDILPVDTQGNIFIPGTGPLQVAGQTHREVDQSVRRAITSVYPDNVEVYTNLQGVQPVAIFVTGYVQHPGRYAGTPSDSVLYYLDQAGGIDQALGSYRDILVMRDGRRLTQLDLYHFLIDGRIPRPQFEDGDTIVVRERGATVAVTGDVNRAYRYEFPAKRIDPAELLELARLESGVSHVLQQGLRDGEPISRYLTLDDFRRHSLEGGDSLSFSADNRSDRIVVTLEGSYHGPSRFALPRDARLSQLLDAIPVPAELSATDSISIQRESVRKRQQKALNDSLRRLETTYLSAPASTNEEAQIRAREAELIQGFIDRARELEPSGRLVVAHQGRITDIRLQDGDVITIPEQSDSLLISGEVQIPQAMVFRPGMNAIDFIERAGGFTQRADKHHILVVRQNGAVENARHVNLRPGDEILVMPAAPTHNLQLASTLTEILYRIAVAARVVVDL